jgi:hypothetical protein
MAVSAPGNGQPLAMQGRVGGKPWRLEIGKSTRKYIRGDELRARAELGVNDDVAVLVMNRPLKEALEGRAYQMFTNELQTTADARLPEEMRWLAMYDEVGWDGLPTAFWDRYAVVADRRDNAVAWVEPGLARLLLGWPEPAPSPEVPFLMLVMRGKAYLRMEYGTAGTPTVQHASEVFTAACEAAIGAFSTDIAL